MDNTRNPRDTPLLELVLDLAHKFIGILALKDIFKLSYCLEF